jgi:UDP-N-acetylglucosamine--N-acetylmuramyl-(pentapeptide) pyrophosphoryl-undecaprenol N-acetylglucosamine transferase
LFPAEALAHELASRGRSVHLVTDARAERFASAFPAERVHVVASATLAGKNPVALVGALAALWRGRRQAAALLRSLGPDAVVGFGGYPTIPPLMAARSLGIPTVIHEQNAVMGRANRLLAPRVTAIAGGFLPKGGGAYAAKTVITGNPVRPAVAAVAGEPYKPPEMGEPFRLLVFGGSQGAHFFSEAVPAAIAQLPETVRARLSVTQQARAEDEAKVRQAYKTLGINAAVAPFFPDLPAKMAAAHLVISRSGASTVSEIAAIGRPSVLVPYPHALDHDQAENAAALKAAGGAEVIAQAELSPERLASILADTMASPAQLAAMAEQARATGKPDAARLLADLVEAIAAGETASQLKRGQFA